MKLTVKPGRLIPPPKPKRQQNVRLDLSQDEANRLYFLAYHLTTAQILDIEERANVNLGGIDLEIINIFDRSSFVPDKENID